MSDELQALRTRVAELQSTLDLAAQEHRVLVATSEAVQALLSRLRDYLDPKVSHEAICNVLRGRDVVAERPYTDRLWRQVTPAYKVDEVTELALAILRGQR